MFSIAIPKNRGIQAVLPAFLLAISALSAAPASGQPQTPPKAAPPPPPALSPEVHHFDSIGLSLNLPLDARMEATRVGGRTTAAIRADDATWMINLQVHDTANEQATITEALDQTIALIQESYGKIDPNRKVIKSTRAQIVERIDDLHIANQPAARVYIRTPGPDGGAMFRGYTIFKPLPKQFVVFELIAPDAGADKARAIYELTIASAAFEDPTLVAMERGAAVKAGVAVLGGLTTADWDALLDGREHWYRNFRPAPGGGQADAEELGYRSIKAWKGRLGEINPGKGRQRWGAAERQEGYLVRVAGRILINNAASNFDGSADFEGIYFLAPDRQTEAWYLRTVVRDLKGEEVTQASESAFRQDDELEVNISASGQPTRTIRPLILDEGYTSQVENYLLPVILARSGLEADFAFYVYQSASETIALRRDSVGRETPGGALVITTQYRAEEEPRRAILNAEGQMTRMEIPDGSLWEPATPEKLHAIWTKKGLPTGTGR